MHPFAHMLHSLPKPLIFMSSPIPCPSGTHPLLGGPMFGKKLIILIPFLLLLVQATAMAQENRLRLFIPFSESMEYEPDVDDLLDSEVTYISATGYGLHYVMPMGLGIGYTSLSSSFSNEVSVKYTATWYRTNNSGTVVADTVINSGTTVYTDTISYTANFLDVSWTFGETFSVTGGLGLVIAGTGELEREFGSTYRSFYSSLSNSTFDADSISGNAFFLHGGYNFGGFELLASYRQSTISTTFEATGNAGFTDLLEQEDVKLDAISSSRMGVGLGWTF